MAEAEAGERRAKVSGAKRGIELVSNRMELSSIVALDTNLSSNFIFGTLCVTGRDRQAPTMPATDEPMPRSPRPQRAVHQVLTCM